MTRSLIILGLLLPLMLPAQTTLVGKRFSSVAVYANDAAANAACIGGLCDPGKWYMVTATGLMRVVPPAGPAGTFVNWPGSTGVGDVTGASGLTTNNSLVKVGATDGGLVEAGFADVVAEWTACSSGYLKFDGTCGTPAGGGSGDVTGGSTLITANHIPYVTGTGAIGIDTTADKQLYRDPSNGFIGVKNITPLVAMDVNGKLKVLDRTASTGATNLSVIAGAGQGTTRLFEVRDGVADWSQNIFYVQPSGTGYFVSLDTTVAQTSPRFNIGTSQSSATFLGSNGQKVQTFRQRDATANNWVGLAFVDSAGGADSAAYGVQFTDHTLHYGAFQFNTRAADGFNPRLRINPDGNIGIGTASPSYRFHMTGVPTSTVFMGLAPTSMANGDVLLYGTVPATTATAISAFDLTGNITGTFAGRVHNSNNTSATALAKIEASVNGASVGDPFYMLTISGVLNVSNGLDNSDNDKLKICPGPNPSSCTVPGITMETTGATAGFVGIGTATPTQKLHVVAGTNEGLMISSDNTGGGSQIQLRGSTNSNNQFNMGFDTTNNYVGLQAITQGVAARQIALNPQGGNVNINTATAPATGTALNVRASTADGTTNVQRWEDSAGAQIAKLDSDGNLTVAGCTGCGAAPGIGDVTGAGGLTTDNTLVKVGTTDGGLIEATGLSLTGAAATPVLRLGHTAGTGNYSDLFFGVTPQTGIRAYTSDDILRFYINGGIVLGLHPTRIDFVPKAFFAAGAVVGTNNTYFRGWTTSNTEQSLIGTNASDKVSIDPSGAGTVFGGAITVTGCTGCGGGGATVASGTAALGTSAIATGACATVVTSAGTGVLTTDTITYTPNADITAVTGYAPSAAGGLVIYPYPTANNVNFKVCNLSVASITPGAVTLNWRVAR